MAGVIRLAPADAFPPTDTDSHPLPGESVPDASWNAATLAMDHPSVTATPPSPRPPAAGSPRPLGDRLVCRPGLFRLLLAACVVVSHASNLEVGRIAVLLFFVLSGYWVYDIWTARFGRDRTALFYASRYLRVAPLYLVGLTLAAVLTGFDVGLVNYAILGAANARVDPLWVSWSLDVELQFYLLLPLLAALMETEPQAFPALTGIAALCGWLLYWRTGVVEIFQYLPAFAAGMLIRRHAWDPGRRVALVSLAAFVLLTLALFLSDEGLPYLLKDRPHLVNRDLFAFAWMIPLLPYLAHALAQPSGALDRHLGNLSYPLYISHPAVMTLFTVLTPHKTLTLKLACLAAILSATVALYAFVDRPCERARGLAERCLRRRLDRRSERGPPAHSGATPSLSVTTPAVIRGDREEAPHRSLTG